MQPFCPQVHGSPPKSSTSPEASLSEVVLPPRVVPPMRGALTRLQQDLVADNGELERLLGVHPRPFHPDRACWGL